MLRVIGCVSQQHDLRLVLVAGLICCFACFTTVNMLSRAASHRGAAGTTWLAGAAFVFGCGVWTTHFVAMLAFDADLMSGYEVTRTALSFFVACFGAQAAFWLFMRPTRSMTRTVCAGFLLGGCIGAMHFIGIHAIRLHGTMSLDAGYVSAALLLGIFLSAVALLCARTLNRLFFRLRSAAWMAAAVIVLHFTGMTAVSLQPGIIEASGDLLIGSTVLATIVIAVTAIILALSLFGAIVDQHLSTRAAREEDSLRHLAHHDPLTGLPNRLQCAERLDQMLASGHAGETNGLVFCLDLDRFKQVNDLLGHQAGDNLLIQVATRLQSLVRPTDLVARMGGDEFVVAVPPPISAGSAALLAGRMVEALAEPFFLDGRQASIGTSIGIALYPVDGMTATDLLRNADTALYQAKKDGRGVYRFFEASMNDRLRRRQMLENDLRQGINNDQLELYYQPLLDMRTRKVGGFEALVRWNHPTRGLVPPSEFIPLAEESGLILPLGHWVLKTACREAASWDFPLRIAVNLSPIQFRQADLAETIAAVLADSGLPANRLELEVTESVLIRHAEQALEILNKLKDQGIKISLDDFGTGYSSLSYLRRFPFHKIKIDRSFIQSLEQDEEAAVIARTIVALGHSLHLEVTAEGVETEGQAAFLEAQECNHLQGYLIGKPVRVSEIAKLIRQPQEAASMALEHNRAS